MSTAISSKGRKASVVKGSKRSGTKSVTQPREPKKTPDTDIAPSPIKQIQSVREQLFRATSIIECCKYASATLLEVSDPEYILPAFDVVSDLVESSLEELGRIVDASEADD